MNNPDIRYYKVDISHNCGFKIKLDANDYDISVLVNNYIKDQNKGESKSDRLFLKKITKITEQQFTKCIWWEKSIRFGSL